MVLFPGGVVKVNGRVVEHYVSPQGARVYRDGMGAAYHGTDGKKLYGNLMGALVL